MIICDDWRLLLLLIFAVVIHIPVYYVDTTLYGTIMIVLENGTYELNEPICITPQIVGTES
jgi:hypothetical protein